MPFRSPRFLAGTLAFTLTLAPLAAHEGWLWAESFHVAPGENARLTLNVGEELIGEPRPFVADRIVTLQHVSPANVTREPIRVPGPPGAPVLELPLTAPGTHVIALDSRPSTLSLPADKFLDYLKLEGLDQIIQLRRETRREYEASRERYWRYEKILLRAGAAGGRAATAPLGQRLEILPVTDPLAALAGDRLAFRVLFQGQPLANALVRAWHRHDGQLLVIKARTAADGSVAFDLPHAGAWLVSLVHLIPLKDVTDLDWESYWGSLTFELGAR